MAVTWPRPLTHALNDPAFPALLNTMEEALNQVYVGTGWRNLAGSLANGWTATFLNVRRVGTRVDLVGVVSGAAATASPLITMNSSFGVDATTGGFMPLPTSVGTVPGADTMRITSAGQLSSGLRVADIRIVASWPANLVWPTTLPGVAL